LLTSKCPDIVEDRGHYFGTSLPDGDKRALIDSKTPFRSLTPAEVNNMPDNYNDIKDPAQFWRVREQLDGLFRNAPAERFPMAEAKGPRYQRARPSQAISPGSFISLTGKPKVRPSKGELKNRSCPWGEAIVARFTRTRAGGSKSVIVLDYLEDLL